MKNTKKCSLPVFQETQYGNQHTYAPYTLILLVIMPIMSLSMPITYAQVVLDMDQALEQTGLGSGANEQQDTQDQVGSEANVPPAEITDQPVEEGIIDVSATLSSTDDAAYQADRQSIIMLQAKVISLEKKIKILEQNISKSTTELKRADQRASQNTDQALMISIASAIITLFFAGLFVYVLFFRAKNPPESA